LWVYVFKEDPLKFNYYSTLFFCVLCVILTSCNPVSQNPNSTPLIATKSINQAYPLATSLHIDSSYPMPTNSSPLTAIPAVTRDANLGIVKGILLLQNKPVVDTNLFLASIIKNSKGTEVAASLDKNTAPGALTDSEGKFSFVNVKPGRYSLMMEAVPNDYLLFKPGVQESIFVTIEKNNTIDLGTLNYDDLPK
jgi:hypothetical protein